MKYVFSLASIISLAFAHNYHGCTLASGNNHGWVVCHDTTLILHTADGCVTWQSQNPPDSSPRYFWDVTCVDSLHAWAIGYNDLRCSEILATTDGGITWETQNGALACYGTRIEFLDQNYGWAVCCDGVLGRTTDSGNYWEQIFTPWYAAEFYGISFVDQYNGWLVAGYPDSVAAGQGMILRSTDGGVNWDSLYQSPTYEDFFDVYFFNLLEGMVVGGDESTYEPIILKTTNGGDTWNSIQSPTNAHYLRAIDFVGDQGWAVGNNGTIIHSSDSGNNWTFQPNPAESTLFDVDFADNLHGITCGNDIILSTTNGGQTWLQSSIKDVQIRECQNTEDLNVYPNPCRNSAVIRYMLSADVASSQKSVASIKIYDVTGRLVRDFPINQLTIQPFNQVAWDGTDDLGRKVPEGIYFVSLTTSAYEQTEKIIFLR